VSGLPGTAWELVRRLVFFYDNPEVLIAYDVIGRDLHRISRRQDE
jgi:hypothetical protein